MPPEPDTRPVLAAGLTLGLGLGGLVDGIVLHQLLQWHHMGTAVRPEADGVEALEANTLWDGLFHAGAWLLVAVGLGLLWRAVRHGHPVPSRAFVGLLVAGWGVFNVIEGLVNHLVLRIHHVRDDLGGPLAWDLGFLAFGVALVLVGWAVWRSSTRATADREIDLRERGEVSARGGRRRRTAGAGG